MTILLSLVSTVYSEDHNIIGDKNTRLLSVTSAEWLRAASGDLTHCAHSANTAYSVILSTLMSIDISICWGYSGYQCLVVDFD